MIYYLDTEFYEDGETIDLISIGVVCEDGREFYAINREARLDLVSPWLREHVLPRLEPYGSKFWKTHQEIAYELAYFVAGTFWGITPMPETARMPTSPLAHPIPKATFWGYYSAYDWVVVCQLFGTMMGLPEYFPRFCRDLKQLSCDRGSPRHPPDPEIAHHALHDARWNKALHAFLLTHPVPESTEGR